MKRKSTSRPVAQFPGKLTGGPGVKVATAGLAVTVQVDYGAVSFFESAPTGEWDILLQRRGTSELSRVQLELTNVDGAAAATAAVNASATAVTASDAAVAAATGAAASEAAAMGAAASAATNASSAGISAAAAQDIAESLAGFVPPPSDTDALVEGATNLYHTQARARAAISAGGMLSYDATTGVVSYTAPTLAPVASSGSAADLTGTLAAAQLPALTGGDVTSTAGSGSLAIGANKVTLAQMAQVATVRFLGRATAGTGDVEALTSAQATLLLDAVTGAGGSANGTKGLVPQPLVADAGKFLKGDGTWSSPAGAGDVIGPASSTANALALFDGTTGKLIKDGGLPDAQYARMDGANAGPLGDRNLLINPEMLVNQRAFAGGALASGVYGFDRWKGGNTGATLSVSGGTISLTGVLTQIVEMPLGLAGEVLTVSVLAPSGALDVTLAAAGTGSGFVSGTISAGAGRRSVTLTLPATLTGNINVTLSSASAITFSQPQVEMGSYATRFRRRPPSVTMAMCERYYQFISCSLRFWAGSTSTSYMSIPLRVRLRVGPTITNVSAGTLTNASGTILNGDAADLTGTVRFTVTPSAAGVQSSALGVTYSLDAEL